MPLTEETDIGRLIEPGDRVDLIGTFLIESKNTAKPEGDGTSAGTGHIALTLLQNVTVVAAGDRISSAEASPGEEAGDDGTGRPPVDSLTLSVSREEALLLRLAEERGVVKPVVRNPEDVAVGSIKRKTLREMLENLEVLNVERKQRLQKQIQRHREDSGDSKLEIIREED